MLDPPVPNDGPSPLYAAIVQLRGLVEQEAARRAELESTASEAAARVAESERQARLDAQRKASAEAAQPRLALAEPAPAASVDRRPPEAGDDHRRYLRELGFRPLPGASRVFLRVSDGPRFAIAEVGDRLVRIELPHTEVQRKNDARALDTSFFPGPVAAISPRRQGTSTVVEIALKQRSTYSQHIDGETLTIDFEPAPP